MQRWTFASFAGLALTVAAAVSAWGQEPVRQLQYMVGEKATILDGLEQRGYAHVRTAKAGGSSYSYWLERSTGSCVTTRTVDGRVASIVYAPDMDCRTGTDHDGGARRRGDAGPGAGSGAGVTLFVDLGFSGSSQSFTSDVADLRGTRIGNDTVTSVRVDPGCRATLYADLDYRGASLELDDDVADLRGSTVGNDAVTSMRVECGHVRWDHSAVDSGVTLYRDLDFSGSSQSFTSDVADLRGTRIGNDTVTSVRVDPGCRATLYADLDYRGASLELDDDVADLRGSTVGNDAVTSMRVECGHVRWDHSAVESGVTLYRDLEFSGPSQRFTSDVADLRGTEIGNDEVTSVRVSRGCRARLFTDADYHGAFMEVDHDVADLRGSKVGNDTVSSVQIECGMRW